MKLEEVIKHCEELADSKYDMCGREYRRLAEWLKELKQYKERFLEHKKGGGIKCWISFAVFLLAFSLDFFCIMRKLSR